MTIGIALTLPDGALLVADGRRTYPPVSHKPPENDVDKLVRISPTIYAIPFGLFESTDFALHLLKRSLTEDCKPERFNTLARICVVTGWTHLLENSDKIVDQNKTPVMIALLAGGITVNEPFITSASYGTGATAESVFYKNDPFQFLILSEEEQGQDLFHQKVSNIQHIPWDSNTGPINTTVKALLDAAGGIIRMVESKNPSIGGVIRYIVIRKGFTVQKAILS